ncbi:hypothetical protein [Lacrimispora sp.]|uniref:hypothetical protein n=1 Tax=Lacrimispora sp. TaxID=2719234 RepID=UPI0034604A00
MLSAVIIFVKPAAAVIFASIFITGPVSSVPCFFPFFFFISTTVIAAIVTAIIAIVIAAAVISASPTTHTQHLSSMDYII